jgi:hypothetical protein
MIMWHVFESIVGAALQKAVVNAGLTVATQLQVGRRQRRWMPPNYEGSLFLHLPVLESLHCLSQLPEELQHLQTVWDELQAAWKSLGIFAEGGPDPRSCVLVIQVANCLGCCSAVLEEGSLPVCACSLESCTSASLVQSTLTACHLLTLAGVWLLSAPIKMPAKQPLTQHTYAIPQLAAQVI